MPVSRRTTAALSTEIVAAYARAEVRLLSLIAQHLAAGHEAPHWAESKLAELAIFRRRAMAIMTDAQREALTAAVGAVERAYLLGQATGQGDLDTAGIVLEAPPNQAERATRALAQAVTKQLDDMPLIVLRQTEDAYRAAVARAVSGTLTGATTRLQDAQKALDDLAGRGITGFVDKAGRNWNLASYAEMATRTATAQAAVLGHLDRLEAAGIPLVIVSDSPRECELCRPWEGKILSRGPIAALQRDHLTGEMTAVHPDGTVAEAIAAGLMHPNCTHSLGAYLPGVTQRMTDTANPQGYEERQRLRELERHVREWKRREAAAVTPEAKKKAGAKVRQWQAEVKAHTEATGLNRQRHREQIGRAL